jgi:predicted phage tail protein
MKPSTEIIRAYKPEGFIQMGVLLLSIVIFTMGVALLIVSAPLTFSLRTLGISLMLGGGIYAMLLKKIENRSTFTLVFFGIGLFALAMIDSALNYS